jgi:queuine/archaeosine tRNA-ribosyltransferase
VIETPILCLWVQLQWECINGVKEDINPDIILGNTYHMRPQTEILEKAGGLHG